MTENGAEPLMGTRGRILEELAVAPLTARDLARKLGIQESAARGHLERMQDHGLVSPNFRKEGVGRPRKRFTLTAQGQELFPRKYDVILDSVVDVLLAHQGEGFVSALFAEAAHRMAQEVTRTLPEGATEEERIRHVVAALNDLGFRSRVEKGSDGQRRIVRSNCIFRHSAVTHPFLMCDVFDKNLTEALLGQSGLALEDSIGRGGIRCSHLLPLQPAASR
jgi:predicted ArsR family transcriptional regulator